MKVAIADDEVLFRKGISLMLPEFGASLLFEADNGEVLLDQLRSVSELPDVDV